MSSAPSPAKSPNRFRRVYVSFLAAFALLTGGFVFVDPYLDAGSVLTRVGDPKATSLLAQHETNPVETHLANIDSPVGPIRARYYVPTGVKNPPAMVVLHGVHHLGIEEPRLVNFSQALASHGVLVMTPEMSDLADYHVEPQAIDVIGLSAQALKKQTGARKVSVLGLSFAGGLALVAASDSRYADDIGVVASIGGHHDLGRVLRYFATNSIEHPDGSKWTVPAHEYGVLVVAYSHPEEFFPPQDTELARAALREQLHENVKEAEVISARLSPAGRERMNLLLAHKTEVISADLLKGILKHEAEEKHVSPSGKLGNIKADVFLAHGAGDNVIPPTETEWTAREVPKDRLKFSLISPVISHVELGHATFADQWRLVHFMKEFLRDSGEKSRARQPLELPAQAPTTK